MKKLLIIIIFVTIPILFLCSFIVSETEYAIVTQFGKPVKIIENPGLYFKMPVFLQKVNRLDKRINLFKTLPIQVLMGDKNPIILTTFVCWKIDDPLIFFQSIIDNDLAVQKLNDMISSKLGATLSNYEIDNIINTDPEKIKLNEIETKIIDSANKSTIENYGIKIISVGIRRLNYPSIVAESVYERMRAEREKEAKKFRAQGDEEASKIISNTNKEAVRISSEAMKKAEIIKGKADKEAMRIYAEAYGQDIEFFDFVKSLETLKSVLENKGTLIISTESELFKYLNYNEFNTNKSN